MKLLRWGEAGRERPGVLDQSGQPRDLSAHVHDLAGDALGRDRLAALREIDPLSLPPVPGDARIGACVGMGGKIIGVGLNYADHVREAGLQIPVEPVLFGKACRLSGPQDAIRLPASAERPDWEIELAVVIGEQAEAVTPEAAGRHIAGYASFIDVSERSLQMQRGGQWIKGKSLASFAPIGPWLVTPDEVPDPQNLPLWLTLNGEMMQDSNTREMLWGVHALVSYVSGFMTLYPGDVIATGTPPGVGMGCTPPRYLRVGDSIRAAVTGLGEHQHQCVAA